jgi:[ribosomal protein S5]-alanine N-acetyltransferase
VSGGAGRLGPIRLTGSRVTLVPFGPEHLTQRYLGWLNDPEVNAYSRRKGVASTIDDARRYIASLRPDEIVLAILVGDRHVGNVKLGPVDWENACADISILVGERDVWGKGVGAEAVYLVGRHLLKEVGLNRLYADSRNPAFLRLVDKLGWRVEGVQRERLRVDGRFVDNTLVALLAREFRTIAAFEPKAG